MLIFFNPKAVRVQQALDSNRNLWAKPGKKFLGFLILAAFNQPEADAMAASL